MTGSKPTISSSTHPTSYPHGVVAASIGIISRSAYRNLPNLHQHARQHPDFLLAGLARCAVARQVLQGQLRVLGSICHVTGGVVELCRNLVEVNVVSRQTPFFDLGQQLYAELDGAFVVASQRDVDDLIFQSSDPRAPFIGCLYRLARAGTERAFTLESPDIPQEVLSFYMGVFDIGICDTHEDHRHLNQKKRVRRRNTQQKEKTTPGTITLDDHIVIAKVLSGGGGGARGAGGARER